ncbi:hypothetical protein EVAR_58066_1 [Eumeta japonica]|uniref:Uncharacterized protein n=1 Tax=Eumeta variegata TaxID=151549 RepID=A0A4C2ADY3_EUMVA|nr:hypothetical protein EVAR_58066_1 [Eumeta japonica]
MGDFDLKEIESEKMLSVCRLELAHLKVNVLTQLILNHNEHIVRVDAEYVSSYFIPKNVAFDFKLVPVSNSGPGIVPDFGSGRAPYSNRGLHSVSIPNRI